MNRSHFAVLALFLAGCATPAGHHAMSPRQEEVASKGAAVMPFDLSRTTHFFDDNARGGIQTVLANDKSDVGQVALIRSHLHAEADRFARGDFSDPASIHGKDMPGLAALSAARDKLRVTCSDVPGGASLHFESADPAVVRAVHDWFAAQRSDHAAHGHMHEHMHQ